MNQVNREIRPIVSNFNKSIQNNDIGSATNYYNQIVAIVQKYNEPSNPSLTDLYNKLHPQSIQPVEPIESNTLDLSEQNIELQKLQKVIDKCIDDNYLDIINDIRKLKLYKLFPREYKDMVSNKISRKKPPSVVPDNASNKEELTSFYQSIDNAIDKDDKDAVISYMQDDLFKQLSIGYQRSVEGVVNELDPNRNPRKSQETIEPVVDITPTKAETIVQPATENTELQKPVKSQKSYFNRIFPSITNMSIKNIFGSKGGKSRTKRRKTRKPQNYKKI